MKYFSHFISFFCFSHFYFSDKKFNIATSKDPPTKTHKQLLLNTPSSQSPLSLHPMPPSYFYNDTAGRAAGPRGQATAEKGTTAKKRAAVKSGEEPVKKIKTAPAASRSTSSRDLTAMPPPITPVLDAAPGIAAAAATEDMGGTSVAV